MAIQNAFASNTIGQTQQVASCIPNTANLATEELPEEQFLLTVIDALERLAIANGSLNFQLSSLVACDAEQAAKNAFCAETFRSPPLNVTPAKLKAIILWQLTQALT